jgi:hypothetical protein
MDRIGSELRQMAVCDITGFEPSGTTTRNVVT